MLLLSRLLSRFCFGNRGLPVGLVPRRRTELVLVIGRNDDYDNEHHFVEHEHAGANNNLHEPARIQHVRQSLTSNKTGTVVCPKTPNTSSVSDLHQQFFAKTVRGIFLSINLPVDFFQSHVEDRNI
jgi:hypothetical protein